MNPKILEDETVLLALLLQADVVPFTKNTAKILSDPYYWKEKLRNLGYVTQNPSVNLRKLYTYIRLYPDIDLAASKACEDNEPEIVQELAARAAHFDPVKCAAVSKGFDVVISLAEVFNTTYKVCALLTTETVPVNYRIAALKHLNVSQIQECLPKIQNPYVFEAIDALGATTETPKRRPVIRISTEYVTQFNIPVALEYILSTARIPQSTIKHWTLAAIKKSLNRNLVLLKPYATSELIPIYLTVAVEFGNLEALKLFYQPEYGGKALQESILRNDISSVKYLKSSVSPKHLKTAKAQRRSEIYNILTS